MTTGPPRVSVVVPNFNYARYLPERLESLLAQTIRDIEVLVLDDASTDDSLAVIDRYRGDPRVRVASYTVNSGHPYARWNDGARLASAPYILFAGADDSCEPTLLETLLAALRVSASCSLAFCDSQEIDESGCVLRRVSDAFRDLDADRWRSDFDCPGEAEARFLLFANTIPNASAVLMRTDRFREQGGFDTSFRLCADWMLWARLLRGGDVAYRQEPLNRFRRHAASVRGTTAGEGLMLAEHYRIVDYLTNAFSSCLRERDRALLYLASAWWRWTLWEPGEWRLRRSFRLYREAARYDSRIPLRLLQAGFRLGGQMAKNRLARFGAVKIG